MRREPEPDKKVGRGLAREEDSPERERLEIQIRRADRPRLSSAGQARFRKFWERNNSPLDRPVDQRDAIECAIFCPG
jgi:hypothetical protein